jgi:hypothetical protein
MKIPFNRLYPEKGAVTGVHTGVKENEASPLRELATVFLHHARI